MKMDVRKTAEYLKSHDNFLILNHRRPDGDAHGSASGLCRGLRAAGKTAYVLYNPDTTEKYVKYVKDLWAPEGYVPGTVVTVDTASAQMLQTNGDIYEDKIDLAIDHHPSNTGYADNGCIYSTCAACGEIVYDILMELNGNVDLDTAAALYIAVSTDTGCFAFANTTANTFRVAWKLGEAGLEYRELNRELFRTKTKSRFALESRIMSGIEFYYGGRVAITTITAKMMDETGCTENDMDDIAAIPGSVQGVECGITMRELGDTRNCKISVRTSPRVDASALCRVLGGGGHMMAAGASPKGLTLMEIKEKLFEGLDKVYSPEDRLR